MRTFDWALFELYNDGHISYEEAIRNADSANELRLNIKLRSERGEPASAAGVSLSLDHMPTPAEEAAARKEEEDRKKELAQQQEHKRQFEAAQLAKSQQEKQSTPELQ